MWVFDICEYGVVVGGEVKNIVVFVKVVVVCVEVGGGCVLVLVGKWLMGLIYFKSNMELYFVEGVEVIFSDKFEDYLLVVLVWVGGVEFYNYLLLIYVCDCENVGIMGLGKLNGNVKVWWGWKMKEMKEIF